MWIYGYVDGEIDERLPDLIEAVEQLQLLWRRRSVADVASLRRGLERLQHGADGGRGAWRPYDEMDLRLKMAAHDGFVGTLSLIQQLTRMREDHGEPRFDGPGGRDHDELVALELAYHAALDFMEEWRPYISYADIALALATVDEVPVERALAAAHEIGRPIPGCPPPG